MVEQNPGTPDALLAAASFTNTRLRNFAGTAIVFANSFRSMVVVSEIPPEWHPRSPLKGTWQCHGRVSCDRRPFLAR